VKLMKFTAIAAAAVIAGSFTLIDDAEAKKKARKCFLAGGDGTAITAELARTNAKTALDNLIATRKAKGTGKVKYECKTTMAVVNLCSATQRACN
jgi:hypothetical protein